jgi:hypothetical protein
VKQEQVSLDRFLANRFGSRYHSPAATTFSLDPAADSAARAAS